MLTKRGKQWLKLKKKYSAKLKQAEKLQNIAFMYPKKVWKRKN